MKLNTRKVIAKVATDLIDMGRPRTEKTIIDFAQPYRDMNAQELKSIAKTIEGIANYWEKNPDRWIRGSEIERGAYGVFVDGRFILEESPEFDLLNDGDTYGNESYGFHDFASPKMCNIGIINYGATPIDRKENQIKGFKQPAKKAITYLQANADFVIDLNDATPLEGNIAGLRMSANAYRFAAAGVPWEKAVRKAFAQNNHLLQVQLARKAARKAAKVSQ